ncbi:MAG: helix-turn-helix transcriptional regulator [Acidimicrobiia bacterium]
MSRLRAMRNRAGLTQADLAAIAGVSRQLVGAVEAGNHLPRVDSAIALAAALGVDVVWLFPTSSDAVDVTTGLRPPERSMVRVGTVGDLTVTAPARTGSDGWEMADGEITGGDLEVFGHLVPGVVVCGCEPGLQVLEGILRTGGVAAVAVLGSNAVALKAIEEGRAHAAVIHGPPEGLTALAVEVDVDRYRLARWRVGLAAPPHPGSHWWEPALGGRSPVIQRESGAGVQASFEAALMVDGLEVPGPRVKGHLEAVRLALGSGIPALTIEPAANALSAPFHPLTEHDAEIWVARPWARDRTVIEALDVISSKRFLRRLEMIGGYDLSRAGERVA